MRLAILGTISPANPSSPAKLTTDAAEAQAHMMQIILSSLTRTPKEAAIPSPRPSRFIFEESNKETAREIKISIAGIVNCLEETPDRPPTEKKL